MSDLGPFGEVIQDAIKAKERADVENGRKYEVRNGIKYCLQCGKPLEVMIEHPLLGKRAYPIICDCDLKAEQEIRDRLAAEENDRRRKSCFGSFAYGLMDARFAADNNERPDVSRKCKNYCKNFEEILRYSQGMIFYGGVGTGKSFMAACIANELIDRGYSAYMTTMSAIERQTSAYMREERAEFIESIGRYDLLIIDDLGSERQTEYMEELTFEIVNRRYCAMRPMIITTNIDIERIKNPPTDYEKRLFDRVLEACSYPIKFEGKSQRRSNVAKRYRAAEEFINEP